MITEGIDIETMRQAVASHYLGVRQPTKTWPNEIAALALLRNVGRRCGWHVQVQISGSEGDNIEIYCVYVRTTGVPPECGGYHHSKSFPLAALSCAYAAIPFDNSK